VEQTSGSAGACCPGQQRDVQRRLLVEVGASACGAWHALPLASWGGCLETGGLWLRLMGHAASIVPGCVVLLLVAGFVARSLEVRGRFP
jgi:hypothetical protein